MEIKVSAYNKHMYGCSDKLQTLKSMLLFS